MRRLKLFIFFSLIKIITLNAEQIYVAPILFVDENEERYEADENFQDDLTYELNEKKEFLGIEVIKTRSHIKNIRSSYDALKLCKEEKISYLIYGWLKKTEYTYECEIRIFDGEGRKNIFTVYAKDGKENYEKFIENISGKILKKLHELFFIPKKEDINKETIINVETGIGYWAYTSGSWVKHLTGTVSLQNGFEVIPDNKVIYIKDKPLYFSIGLSIDYLLGVSKKGSLQSYVNTISSNVYTNTYLNVHDIHNIYANLGMLYCLDLLYYKDKYRAAEVNASGAFGLIIGGGYKYTVKPKLKLIFEFGEEIIFYSKLMSKFRGKFGIEFEVFKKEYKVR